MSTCCSLGIFNLIKQAMAKKNFALRVEEDLLKAIEKWAADEFRSTNGQLEWLISEALKKAGRSKKLLANNSKEGTEQ